MSYMNKDTDIITAVDSSGNDFPLNLKELDTVDHYNLMGGAKLIIFEFHDYVPPVSCTCVNCDELADYLCLVIEKNVEHIACLCDEHLNELISEQQLEAPFRILH